MPDRAFAMSTAAPVRTLPGPITTPSSATGGNGAGTGVASHRHEAMRPAGA